MSRRLFGTFSSFIFIVAITSASVAAQTGAPRVPAPSTTPRAESERRQRGDATRTSADEDFELNISERRIDEADYEASTAVEAGDVGASGLTLRVGVMLNAAEIDVLLRNVRGRVRFRGNLEAVLRRLGLQRREATTAPAPQPPNPSP